MTSTQPDSTPPQLPVGTDEENLKLASQIAAVNLLFAQRELGNRIIDPTITTKGLLDIAEHSYKVSGMQKKLEPNEQTGKFVFNINFKGGQSVTIEKETQGEVLEHDSPESLAATGLSILPTLNIEFDSSPEFS